MLRLIFLLLLACLFATQASADLPAAEGTVLLTIIGKIRHTNRLELAEFDQQLLESLEQQEVTTHNPNFVGNNTYSGPLMRALVEAVGADKNSNMRIISLNGFVAEIPVSDSLDYDLILALKKNGRLQRIRDRGPLFTIYPFDEHPHLNTEMHYNRSVWQVKTIEFF